MAYYLAPALVQLRNQINARWANRSKASDGWISDAAYNELLPEKFEGDFRALGF